MIPQVNPTKGGIAVDTKNGINVFVAYKQLHKYMVHEYWIDYAQKEWDLINEVRLHSKILDVDVAEEFAII